MKNIYFFHFLKQWYGTGPIWILGSVHWISDPDPAPPDRILFFGQLGFQDNNKRKVFFVILGHISYCMYINIRIQK
jgi:hypothetical protein